MCFYHKSKVCWVILQIWRLWASLCGVTSLRRPSWRASVRRSPTSCPTAGPEMGPLLCSSKSSIWPCPTSAWPATASLTPHWRRYTKRGIDKLAKDTHTCTVQSVPAYADPHESMHRESCCPSVSCFSSGVILCQTRSMFCFPYLFFFCKSNFQVVDTKELNNYAALFFYAKTFYMKHTHKKQTQKIRKNRKNRIEVKKKNLEVMRRWDTGSLFLKLWVWSCESELEIFGGASVAQGVAVGPGVGGQKVDIRRPEVAGEGATLEKLMRRILTWIWCLTGSQWRCWRIGPDVFSEEGGCVFLEVGDRGGRREIWRHFWCVIATLSEVKRKWT